MQEQKGPINASSHVLILPQRSILGDDGGGGIHDGEEVSGGNRSGTAFEYCSAVTASLEYVNNTQTVRSVLPGVKLPRLTK